MSGWRRNNISFGVKHIPERKKPVLYVQDDGAWVMVGQLKDDDAAELFMDVIDHVMIGNEFKNKIKERFE